MFPTLVRAAEVGLLALIGYTAVTALPGWGSPERAPRSERRQRFRVVIPAHNESTVIQALLGDLGRLDYDTELFSVWVVADRCTDDTASIARAAGARVQERATGTEGKGAVLREHLEAYPLGGDEALVVVDADNRVPAELLGRFADEIAAGGHALQAYLDVANPGASLLATASALSYWAGNRMVQLARTRLGWPADLGGTGMCLTHEALQRSGGFGDSITDDADLGARLARAGIPVRWIHDVRIRDEKPTTVGVVVRQRARWTAGRREVARRHALPLVAAAVRRGEGGLADLALRLVQPGRSFVALLSAVLAMVAATVGSELMLPAALWGGAAAVQFLMPLAFLAREGVPRRYLLAYPLLALLAALWIPVRVASRLTRGWYHTPHQGG